MESFGIMGIILLWIAILCAVYITVLLSKRLKISPKVVVIVALILGVVAWYLSPVLLEKQELVQYDETLTQTLFQKSEEPYKAFIVSGDYHQVAVVGFGNRAGVVYTSKTVNTVSMDMLQGVTTHEVGHIKYYHSMSKILLLVLIVYIGVTVFISLSGRRAWTGVFLFSLLGVIGYFAYARYVETQADLYAMCKGLGNELAAYFEVVQGEKRQKQSFTCEPRFEKIRCLHPPLIQRIQFLKK